MEHMTTFQPRPQAAHAVLWCAMVAALAGRAAPPMAAPQSATSTIPLRPAPDIAGVIKGGTARN